MEECKKERTEKNFEQKEERTKEMTELKHRENMGDDRVEEGENGRFLSHRRRDN
jgi:hypothetical protein